MGYFEHYSQRMTAISNALLALANDFKSNGYDVWVSGIKDNRKTMFMVVCTDDKHLVFGFSEVPYRWYVQANIKPSKENGSGYTVNEWGYTTTDKIPSMIEISEYFRPNYEGMKKQYSHLTKI